MCSVSLILLIVLVVILVIVLIMVSVILGFQTNGVSQLSRSDTLNVGESVVCVPGTSWCIITDPEGQQDRIKFSPQLKPTTSRNNDLASLASLATPPPAPSAQAVAACQSTYCVGPYDFNSSAVYNESQTCLTAVYTSCCPQPSSPACLDCLHSELTIQKGSKCNATLDKKTNALEQIYTQCNTACSQTGNPPQQ
jgi:hypothetical protein